MNDDFVLHFFLAKNIVTKTRAGDFLLPGYKLTDIFQDQHISNLCFPIDFCSHLFQPYVQRKKLHLRGTMHLENNYYYSPLLALGFEGLVHRCAGCSQSVDGRVKKGTEQPALQGTGKQDRG